MVIKPKAAEFTTTEVEHMASIFLLYRGISETLSSPEFAQRHRVDEKAFTRERKLPLPQLVKYLLNLRKGANQDELDRFFEVVCDHHWRTACRSRH
jgi:hypothetical protein